MNPSAEWLVSIIAEILLAILTLWSCWVDLVCYNIRVMFVSYDDDVTRLQYSPPLPARASYPYVVAQNTNHLRTRLVSQK